MTKPDIVKRLRRHSLPDPCDEREVLHASLLREAAELIERYERILEHVVRVIQAKNKPLPVVDQEDTD